ncbi:MAG: hypothetical protein RBR35_01365 [Salinivirgaceae bacterium]|nr:hypothetical protein [Salinivirgaceae bacterium]
MSLDFTFGKYKEIIAAIADSEYQVLKIKDYITRDKLPEKFIIIRHDVDLDAYYQLKFAQLEHQHNIHTSYYFRKTDKTFKEDVINEVAELGHEVGYHYEVFTKALGDPIEAMRIFRNEQAVFSEKWKSLTVCPHGGSFVDNADGYSLKNMVTLIPKLVTGKIVFSKHVNFDMWKENKFDDFGIIGDAYKSVDFSDILYLSDTGRSWDQRYKRLDKVDSSINPLFDIKSSNDIIDVIEKGEVNKIYLLVHFEQWKDNLFDWLGWYAAQVIRRTGKRIIFRNK